MQPIYKLERPRHGLIARCPQTLRMGEALFRRRQKRERHRHLYYAAP